MGRKGQVALYRIYASEKSHRYVRMVKSGRSWAPLRPRSPTTISPRKSLRDAMSEFLKDKTEATRYILGVFGKFYGWDNIISTT